MGGPERFRGGDLPGSVHLIFDHFECESDLEKHVHHQTRRLPLQQTRTDQAKICFANLKRNQLEIKKIKPSGGV